MRLYSYRGVSYTIAPPALSPTCPLATGHDPIDGPSSVEQPLKQDSKQPSQKSSSQKLAPPQPQPPIPTAVIPVVYRGVLHLLERFHTPCPAPSEDLLEDCADESIEAAESAKSADE